MSLYITGTSVHASTLYMTGLLHDTVEDTDLTFYKIEEQFGHTMNSFFSGGVIGHFLGGLIFLL